MSDLFLKNSVKNNNFHNLTESSFNLNKILNINPVNKVNNTQDGGSVTSSAIMQPINELSSTSYNNNTQVGGGSITSSANLSKINSNDINNLLAMLTSESNANTVTEDLENRLKKLLTQNGGGFTDDMNTENMNTENLESRIKNIQSGGNKTLMGLVGLAGEGTGFSEFNSKTVMDNNKNNVIENLNVTSFEMPSRPIFTKGESNNQIIGTTTEIPSSATSSAMPDSRLRDLVGGNHPAMVVYREICKLVSEKLKITNGPNCKKIAGQLQKDVKKKMPDITHDKLLKAAEKYLTDNMKEYQEKTTLVK